MGSGQPLVNAMKTDSVLIGGTVCLFLLDSVIPDALQIEINIKQREVLKSQQWNYDMKVYFILHFSALHSLIVKSKVLPIKVRVN